jgi:hypothetical protein
MHPVSYRLFGTASGLWELIDVMVRPNHAAPERPSYRARLGAGRCGDRAALCFAGVGLGVAFGRPDGDFAAAGLGAGILATAGLGAAILATAGFGAIDAGAAGRGAAGLAAADGRGAAADGRGAAADGRGAAADGRGAAADGRGAAAALRGRNTIWNDSSAARLSTWHGSPPGTGPALLPSTKVAK